MLVIPIDTKKERVTRTLCGLKIEKINKEGAYKGTYKDSYQKVWDELMTETQKRGYTFEQIFEYMINS